MNFHAPRILVDPRLIEKQGKDTVEILFYLQPGELDSASMAIPGLGPPTKSFISDSDAKRYHLIFPEQVDNADTTTAQSPASSFYDIYFAKSKDIFLPKSDNALFELNSEMKNNPNLEIMIIGHTDNIGDGNALVELSNKRAEAVKKFLVQSGISGARIHTFGVGAADPLFENTTESNRERNRRVEIIVMKK